MKPKLLEDLKKAHGLTSDIQLAVHLGVTPEVISRIRRGEHIRMASMFRVIEACYTMDARLKDVFTKQKAA